MQRTVQRLKAWLAIISPNSASDRSGARSARWADEAMSGFFTAASWFGWCVITVIHPYFINDLSLKIFDIDLAATSCFLETCPWAAQLRPLPACLVITPRRGPVSATRRCPTLQSPGLSALYPPREQSCSPHRPTGLSGRNSHAQEH